VGVTFQVTYVQAQDVFQALDVAHRACDKAQQHVSLGDTAQAWEVLNDRQRCLNAALRFTGYPCDGVNAIKRRIGAAGATPEGLVAALRQQLMLSAVQWGKLGCCERWPLPGSVPGSGERCSYGDALKVLQAQHALVGMTGDDPSCWKGNRWELKLKCWESMYIRPVGCIGHDQQLNLWLTGWW
jgi:hypothetical protein